MSDNTTDDTAHICRPYITPILVIRNSPSVGFSQLIRCTNKFVQLKLCGVALINSKYIKHVHVVHREAITVKV